MKFQTVATSDSLFGISISIEERLLPARTARQVSVGTAQLIDAQQDRGVFVNGPNVHIRLFECLPRGKRMDTVSSLKIAGGNDTSKHHAKPAHSVASNRNKAQYRSKHSERFLKTRKECLQSRRTLEHANLIGVKKYCMNLCNITDNAQISVHPMVFPRLEGLFDVRNLDV